MKPNAARRVFLLRLAASGVTLPPLAAWLAACTRTALPEGMAEIKWDRDTCARCSMVISDRRFAAELRGGPDDKAFKFDDIGCATFWLRQQSWGNDAGVRIWVAAANSRGNPDWLDARAAHYIGGLRSPMGYNFGAVALPQAGSLDFAAMRGHVLAKGR